MAEYAVQREANVAEHASVAAPDGYRLRFRRYPSQGDTRAVIVCHHGIQSHGGWYAASCRMLAEAGYEILFFDRRGSGMNQANRGHCRNYRQLRDDLITSVKHARVHRPGLSVVLLTISWGGKLALAALKQDSKLVDAAVFLCPGWFAKVTPTLREKLTVAWSVLFRPRRLIDIPLSDPALFTANPEWQSFLMQDPLSLRQGTARLLFTSRVLDRVIAGAPESMTCPVLLMLAGRDRIIDNAKTVAFFERFTSENKRHILYEAAHHTLEFEPNPNPIFEDLIGWLHDVVREGLR